MSSCVICGGDVKYGQAKSLMACVTLLWFYHT